MYKLSINDLTGLNQQELTFVVEYCRDKSPRRAAEAAGYRADDGHKIRERPHVASAISKALQQQVEAAQVDAEWVLNEAVGLYGVAMDQGKLTAANTTLSLIAKHTMVDAMASDKMNMNIHADKDVLDRLSRGRQRARARGEVAPGGDDPPDFR